MKDKSPRVIGYGDMTRGITPTGIVLKIFQTHNFSRHPDNTPPSAPKAMPIVTRDRKAA